MAFSRCYLSSCVFVAAFAALCARNGAAQAASSQQSSSSTSSSSHIGNTSINTDIWRSSDMGFPSHDLNLSHRQQVARREELHRKLLDNAARLLTLTRELQQDLHEQDANDTDAKRLDDIGKLARTIRDQMLQ